MTFSHAIPTLREPPSEAEIAYVRALVRPLEEAVPPHRKDRPKRVWPKRAATQLTPRQLLAEYQQVSRYCPGMNVAISRLLQTVLYDD